MDKNDFVLPEGFKKEVVITGAFDKRSPEPSKNYGIHGMEFRLYLIGDKGAVQYVYYSAQYLKHVSDEMAESILKKGSTKYHPFSGMAADLGYHSPKPMFEGQSPSKNCHLIGCDCYYDGSGLNASSYEETFLSGGSDAMWPILLNYYYEVFND